MAALGTHFSLDIKAKNKLFNQFGNNSPRMGENSKKAKLVLRTVVSVQAVAGSAYFLLRRT